MEMRFKVRLAHEEYSLVYLHLTGPNYIRDRFSRLEILFDIDIVLRARK